MPRALFAPLCVALLATSFGTLPVLAATTDNWTDGTGNWSTAANWTNTSSGHTVPAAGDTVNIVDSDGVSRTITYNYTGAAITLGTVTIDLTGGAGAATNTLSMSANNLTAALEIVGANGAGAFTQSGGANSVTGTDSLAIGLQSAAVGTYTLSGGSLAISGNFFVGDLGTGTFTQTGGTNTVTAGSNYFLIGAVANSYGTYNLSGTGAVSAGDEYVGDSGTGAFNQSGGTNTLASGHSLYLGYTASSSGTYTLSGAGSLSTTPEYIGYMGAGTFIQNGGSNVANAFISVADQSGSTGTYTLNNGTLSANEGELIGNMGTGTFNQTGGSNTLSYGINSNLFIGYLPGSTGTYNLSGTGALLAVGDTGETVGFSGNGTLNQSGGTNTISSLQVGSLSNSIGSYTLSGGSLTSAGPEYIGSSGAGSFNQSGGTHTISGTGNALCLGFSSGSTGTYNLSGGTASVGGSIYVGGGSVNPGGTGVLTVSGDGSLTVGGTITVYNATGNALNLNGGTITALGLNLSGNPALFNWTAGDLNLTGEPFVVIDNSVNANLGSTLTLDSSKSLSVGFGETVGNQGTGSVIQSGGTNNVGTSIVFGGSAGSSGTYTLSGTGSLTVGGQETLGGQGTGTFNQTGGTNRMTSSSAALCLGFSSGSTGTYNLSGGTASVGGSIYVGGGSVNPGGTGVLRVSGDGSLTVGGTITVYNATGNALNLNGGTITALGLNLSGNPALFNWTSGTLNLTSNGTFDYSTFGSSLTLAADQTFTNAGSETIGGTSAFNLELSAGNVHTVAGSITVGPLGILTLDSGSSLTYGGSFIQNGGTVSGNIQNQTTYTFSGGQFNGQLINQGTFTYSGGQFNGQLINQGTAAFEANFTATGGMENDSTVSITGNRTLTFNGPGLDNFGIITLATLQTLAGTQIINDVGGVINSAGTIAAPFVNYGTFYSSAASGLISVTGAMTNYGLVGPVATGTSFRPAAGLDNLGTVLLNGGSISGSDPVTNDFGGLIQSGVGTYSGVVASGVSAPLNNIGGVIVASSNTILNLTNFGSNASGGQMLIENAATLNALVAFDNSGTINLQGASAMLAGGLINNAGTISGLGRVSNAVANTGMIHAVGGTLTLAGTGNTNPAATGTTAAGQIQIDSGSTVVFSQGLATNGGSISLTGGTFDNNAHLLSNPGAINGYGTVRTGGLTINSGGLLSVGGGDMNVMGTVTNNGTVNIQSGRTLYFYNNVNGAGVYTGAGTADYLASLSPGNSPASINFAGGVILGGAVSLLMELGGTTPGTQFDQVHVGGSFSLGGTLEVLLINGFTPVAGNSFDLMDWGSLNGTFSALQLPSLSGPLAWNTSQLYTTGVLSVVTTYLPGDFNRDGHVDAADIGPMMAALANLSGYNAAHSNLTAAQLLDIEDVNGDGVVNNADLQALLDLLNSGGGSSNSVPEPASLALLGLGALAIAYWHRFRKPAVN